MTCIKLSYLGGVNLVYWGRIKSCEEGTGEELNVGKGKQYINFSSSL